MAQRVSRRRPGLVWRVTSLPGHSGASFDHLQIDEKPVSMLMEAWRRAWLAGTGLLSQDCVRRLRCAALSCAALPYYRRHDTRTACELDLLDCFDRDTLTDISIVLACHTYGLLDYH